MANVKYPLVKGSIYGDWTVISNGEKVRGRRHWRCRCKCGLESDIRVSALVNLRSKRCETCSRATTKHNFVHGDKVGKWVILRECDRRLGKRYLLCRCICGEEYRVSVKELVKGASLGCVSCRSYQHNLEATIPIPPGTKYRNWTVIRDAPRKWNVRQFLCKCACGCIKVVSRHVLTSCSHNHCMKCSLKGTHDSKGERGLYDWIKLVYDGKVIRNDRSLLGRKEIDIYLPDLKLGIEYNGNYWHSEEKSTNPNRHFAKRVIAKGKDVKLLQIRSDEWSSKKEIVKSILLQHIQNSKTRYFARKCKIRVVSRRDYNSFLKDNHLMGGFKAGRGLGLYSPAGELLQLFVYRLLKNRRVLECSRICSKIDTLVVGGMSRLLKYTTKLYSTIKSIISFVDLRYADGHSLLSLGFICEKVTRGWAWVDGDKVYNRLKCRANMDSRKLTQAQHAEELGWHKLYDAGQAKFVLNF